MTATEFRLTGQLGDAAFLDWICHRARLLDLRGWVAAEDAGCVRLLVTGPEPLIDAMEMACSLGPVTVDVMRIERQERTVTAQPNGFQKANDGRQLHIF